MPISEHRFPTMNQSHAEDTPQRQREYSVRAMLYWMVDTPEVDQTCQTLRAMLGIEATVVGVVDVGLGLPPSFSLTRICRNM